MLHRRGVRHHQPIESRFILSRARPHEIVIDPCDPKATRSVTRYALPTFHEMPIVYASVEWVVSVGSWLVSWLFVGWLAVAGGSFVRWLVAFLPSRK